MSPLLQLVLELVVLNAGIAVGYRLPREARA